MTESILLIPITITISSILTTVIDKIFSQINDEPKKY